ncbi:hypothetical protein GsuE55_04030 [Geobacillus subterraneus]|uniref:Uncharacterized protein n=1 Tax=Geobacillus subterraneus TaxID=129338 RepID=A0A679FIT6_9BACL|nr:hypothetical protein GsuE55_04030 [Geobacillus subterraneus]
MSRKNGRHQPRRGPRHQNCISKLIHFQLNHRKRGTPSAPTLDSEPRRGVKNRCHTPIDGMFIQKRKLIPLGFSN